jgi:Siphovirus Gp157
MNRDPRFALSQELKAKQTLLDQLRALAVEDPDFLTDLIEGETDLLELMAAIDASIIDDEIIADGARAALDKLQARKRAAETRIELKRRLLAHTLQQIGLKTLRTPTATLTIADASLKAIAVAPEDIPARWWKPQPPKLDQDGLTKAIRAREKALKEAEAIPDAENVTGLSPPSRPSIHRSPESPHRMAASTSSGESDHAPDHPPHRADADYKPPSALQPT